MVKDTDHRKRLIIELIKIKVKTGQPLDKILTKLTRDRYKHWNWSQVIQDIEHFYYKACEPETDEERAQAEQIAADRLNELKQNY